MQSRVLQGRSVVNLSSARSVRRASGRTLTLRVSAKKPGETPVQAKVSTKQGLQKAKEDIRALLKEKPCYPIMVRLAWHDAGTFSTVCASFSSVGSEPGRPSYLGRKTSV